MHTLQLGFQVVRWGANAWWRREQRLREGEAQLLGSARQHQGWLTEAQLLGSLGDDTRAAAAVVARLEERGLCHRYPARNGSSVYVFPHFLQLVRECAYCGQEPARRLPLGPPALSDQRGAGRLPLEPPALRCGCCGAPTGVADVD